MIIEAKNLPSGRWIRIVSVLRPTPGRFHRANVEHATVTVDTADGKQRLDVLFTKDEVEAMLAVFRDEATLARETAIQEARDWIASSHRRQRKLKPAVEP